MAEPHFREIHVEPAKADQSALVITFASDDLRPPQRLQTIDNEMGHVLDQSECRRLVIDFSEVEFAPSSLFGIVLRFVMTGKEKGVETRLCGLHHSMRRAFELINAKDAVSTFPKRSAAVRAPWPKEEKASRRSKPLSKPWWRFWPQ